MKTSRILPEGVGGGRNGIRYEGVEVARRMGEEKEGGGGRGGRWGRKRRKVGEEEEGGRRTNLEWLWHIQVASLHVL